MEPTESKFSVYAIGYTLIPDAPTGVPYYSVVASADEGGTVSPEGRTRVRRGRDVTVTITPDEGFVIADVVVDRRSVGAVREYTFEKMSTGHSLHAVFAKQTACPIHPFADAAPTAWYHDGVHFCLERGLMQGYGGGLFGPGDGRFGPDDPITREQLAAMLHRFCALTGN